MSNGLLTCADIERLDGERRLAMLNGDVAALEQLVSEDLTWVHASSRTEDKTSFLDGFRTGRLRCLSLEQRRVTIRCYGEVAQVIGIVAMDVCAEGVRRSSTNRFSCLWVQQQARCQLVHWQSTRIPSDG